MKRKPLGMAIMLVGLALLLCAGGLLIKHASEERHASESAEALLDAVISEIAESSEGVTPFMANGVLTAEYPLPEMPEIEADGEACIGYLELPTIGIKLPVLSEWSYERLLKAPCRYTGNAYDDSMIILAHSYDRHFGRLGELEVGDAVQFIDAESNIFRYTLSALETLEATDVTGMVKSDYDLTLFSCTRGGEARLAARLTRTDRY